MLQFLAHYFSRDLSFSSAVSALENFQAEQSLRVIKLSWENSALRYARLYINCSVQNHGLLKECRDEFPVKTGDNSFNLYVNYTDVEYIIQYHIVTGNGHSIYGKPISVVSGKGPFKY